MNAAARPMTQAERAKLSRSRQARGVRVYKVEVDGDGLNMLVWRGLLTDAETADDKAVGNAIGLLLTALAKDEFASRVTLLARGLPYDARSERK